MIFDRIVETGLTQETVQSLLEWFRRSQRQMEWRSNPSPYYVWVSEIMLQQTRVEAVRPYFHRFITQLPDIPALAQCDEEKLLKLWEGLGYYNRVRNMQKAAIIVVNQYGGILPSDPHMLMELPGIGAYTAGAIASIAYGVPEAAVDGNVLRVLSRLTGSDECIDEPKVKVRFEQLVRDVLRAEDAPPPGEFNQALMEFGALICLPGTGARCSECPVRDACAAYMHGEQAALPVRKAKKPRRIEKRTILVVRDATRTVIRKRPERGLLAGLWELPGLEGHLTQRQILDAVSGMGIRPLRITPLPESKHIFSHVEWHMHGYLILSEDLEDLKNGCIAVEPVQTQKEYSIPAAFAGYTDYLYDTYEADRKREC